MPFGGLTKFRAFFISGDLIYIFLNQIQVYKTVQN